MLNITQVTEGRCTTKIVRREVFGICLHTTGSGITTKAKKTGKLPIEVALKWYMQSQNGANGYLWGGPTYVVDHDGSVYQLADEDIVTHHCGSNLRAKFLDGSWVNLCDPKTVSLWFTKWTPRFKNPQCLFPSKSPNTDYVGVEMIPCGSGFGTPMDDGLKFSQKQHEAAKALVAAIATRHNLPHNFNDPMVSGRLVGHEDLQPISSKKSGYGRSDAGGGWDPGSLRDKPYFDFNFVRRL